MPGDPSSKCEHCSRSTGLTVLPVISRPDVFLSVWSPVTCSLAGISTHTGRQAGRMSLKAMTLTPARWSQKHQTIPSVVHRLSGATGHKPPSREMKASQPQTTQNAPNLEASSPLLSTDVSGTDITIQDGKQQFQKKTQIRFLIKPKVIHSSKSRGA